MGLHTVCWRPVGFSIKSNLPMWHSANCHNLETESFKKSEITFILNCFRKTWRESLWRKIGKYIRSFGSSKTENIVLLSTATVPNTSSSAPTELIRSKDLKPHFLVVSLSIKTNDFFPFHFKVTWWFKKMHSFCYSTLSIQISLA